MFDICQVVASMDDQERDLDAAGRTQICWSYHMMFKIFILNV